MAIGTSDISKMACLLTFTRMAIHVWSWSEMANIYYFVVKNAITHNMYEMACDTSNGLRNESPFNTHCLSHLVVKNGTFVMR